MDKIDTESIPVSSTDEKTVFNTIQGSNSKDWLKTADIPERPKYSKTTIFMLAIQSIGVIYGDIGTSPLYVYSSTFSDNPSSEQIKAALSMIIWTLSLVVTLKYVFFVLLADDNGEGGTFALYSLLSRYANISWQNPNKAKKIGLSRFATGDLKSINQGIRGFIEQSIVFKHLISFLAITGVSMVMADGVLTPAQSVLGSIQGLTLYGVNQSMVVLITCIILILLFIIQPFGTTKIAFTFAPIVVIWLLWNLVIGVYNLAMYDYTVLEAFSPYWIYYWFKNFGQEGWIQMGGILLSYTGVEAMFADLGHFSRPSVQLSWSLFVYPCLLVAYIGQAAYISVNPSAWANPFYATLPNGLFWPSFVIAILATIVASQAMITGCFSILVQAMSLSNFPRLKVIHTSERFHGQVYIPVANWILMVGTVVVTAAFNNTTSLGNAYGLCVTFVTLITTTMITIVSIIVWRWNIAFSLIFFFFFAFIDCAYISATLLKVPQGAWFTLVISFVLVLIMSLWHWGKVQQWTYEGARRMLFNQFISTSSEKQDQSEAPELTLLSTGETLARFKGLSVVFDSAGFDTPTVFSHFVKSFGSVPQVTVFVHVSQVQVPHVAPSERFVIFRLDAPNMYRVIIRQGYNDMHDNKTDIGTVVVDRLEELLTAEFPSEAATVRVAADVRTTYLMGTIEFKASPATKKYKLVFISLFNFFRKNTRGVRRAAFGIPADKLVEVGMVYEL